MGIALGSSHRARSGLYQTSVWTLSEGISSRVRNVYGYFFGLRRKFGEEIQTETD